MTAAVDRCAALWRLEREGKAIETPTSTIQFVRRNGEPCVLKIARRNSDEMTAEALAHFAGHGAVELLARDDNAVLMRRAVPGTPLSERTLAGDDDEATRIVCRTISALHAAPPPKGEFRTVENWGRAFARPAAARLPAQLVEDGARLYDELCRSQSAPVLLHGDLHHDNILLDEARGWLAVDPKGVIGESVYETGAALRNPTDDHRRFAVPAIIDRRVRIMCEMQGWDRSRVLRWCFAQAVLSAIWSIEDGEDPIRGLATAEATRTLI